MKRLAASLVFVLMSSLAFALPSPRDIETAVNAGQLTQAESMLNEVLREKPNSAKAHYELGEVLARQGRNADARRALLEAQRLDPALKFARSPQQFNDLLKKIPAASSTAASSTAASSALSSTASSTASSASPTLSVPSSGGLSQMAPVQAPAAPSFPWTYVLLGGGALFAG